MRNIKLTLEYDGTNFSGWQLQPKVRTVQGELETALRQLLQQGVRVIGSGRTDVGVHALGQVANFKTTTMLSLPSIQKGLNALLARDVVVLHVEEVSEDFHARYSAQKREYRYVISTRPRAVGRFYAWYVRYPLDVEKMQEASQCLLGEHDFRSFSLSGSPVKHYRCKVERAAWTEGADEVIFEIVADRFLRGMVRSIVGTMVQLCAAKVPVEQVKAILESQDRRAAGPTAPARGLFLTKVYY